MTGRTVTSPLRTVGAAGGLLIAATAASLLVALGNSLWFDLLNGVLALTQPLPRALLFSAYLLVLGGVIVVGEPRDFGFRVGLIREHIGFVTVVTAVTAQLALANRPFSLGGAGRSVLERGH